MTRAAERNAVSEITLSDIEQTMQLARAELEHEIALFRIVFTSVVFVLSTIAIGIGTLLGGDAPLWIPPYFAAATAAAAAIYRVVRRNGATARLTYLSIVFDVAVLSGVHIVSALSEAETNFEGIQFPSWVSGGALATVLFLHSLRNDRRALAFCTALCLTSIVSIVLFTNSATMDEKGMAYVTLGYRSMGPDVLIPLLTLTAGTVGIAAALGFYADAHARRRLRIHARVLRYVPDAAYQQVYESKGESTDAGIRAPGRLVEVTIVASDLRGFTAMSERVPPQEMVRQLNAFHDAMVRQIERHGGMLDKLIGDGELAIFGWRGDAPDSGANDAVACARAMRRALTDLNRERAQHGLEPLAMGIGIHTGPCVAGNIGAGKKLSWTYIGDAVNAASRIEGLTKELGAPVLASEDTVSRLETRAGIRRIGPTTIRGKAEPITLHAIE